MNGVWRRFLQRTWTPMFPPILVVHRGAVAAGRANPIALPHAIARMREAAGQPMFTKILVACSGALALGKALRRALAGASARAMSREAAYV